MTRIFLTPFNHEPDKGEVNSGELKVETAGYVPADKLVKRMIDAGKRLAMIRASGAGYGDEGLADGEEPVVDPTADADFDLADASNLAQSLIDKETLSKEASENTKKDADVAKESDEVEDETETK